MSGSTEPRATSSALAPSCPAFTWSMLSFPNSVWERTPRNSVSWARSEPQRETEFRRVRSQTEFGNEGDEDDEGDEGERGRQGRQRGHPHRSRSQCDGDCTPPLPYSQWATVLRYWQPIAAVASGATFRIGDRRRALAAGRDGDGMASRCKTALKAVMSSLPPHDPPLWQGDPVVAEAYRRFHRELLARADRHLDASVRHKVSPASVVQWAYVDLLVRRRTSKST